APHRSLVVPGSFPARGRRSSDPVPGGRERDGRSPLRWPECLPAARPDQGNRGPPGTATALTLRKRSMVGRELAAGQQSPEEVLENLTPLVFRPRAGQVLRPEGALVRIRRPAQRTQIELLDKLRVGVLAGEQLAETPLGCVDLRVQ